MAADVKWALSAAIQHMSFRLHFEDHLSKSLGLRQILLNYLSTNIKNIHSFSSAEYHS